MKSELNTINQENIQDLTNCNDVSSNDTQILANTDKSASRQRFLKLRNAMRKENEEIEKEILTHPSLPNPISELNFDADEPYDVNYPEYNLYNIFYRPPNPYAEESRSEAPRVPKSVIKSEEIKNVSTKQQPVISAVNPKPTFDNSKYCLFRCERINVDGILKRIDNTFTTIVVMINRYVEAYKHLKKNITNILDVEKYCFDKDDSVFYVSRSKDLVWWIL